MLSKAQRAAACCLACSVRCLTRACVATREGIMTPCALADTALPQEGLPSSPRMLAPAAPSTESRLPLAVWLLLPVHGRAGAPAAGIAAAVRAVWWGVGGLLLTALARNDVPRSCTTLRRPLRRTAGAPQIQPFGEKNPLTQLYPHRFISAPCLCKQVSWLPLVSRHAVHAGHCTK